MRSRPSYDERYKKLYNSDPPKNVKTNTRIYKKHILFGWQVYENIAFIEIDINNLIYINSEGFKVTILKNAIKYCLFNIEKKYNCISVKIDNKSAVSFGIPNYLMFELSNIDEKNDCVTILTNILYSTSGSTTTTSDIIILQKLSDIELQLKKDEILAAKDSKKLDRLFPLIDIAMN